MYRRDRPYGLPAVYFSFVLGYLQPYCHEQFMQPTTQNINDRHRILPRTPRCKGINIRRPAAYSLHRFLASPRVSPGRSHYVSLWLSGSLIIPAMVIAAQAATPESRGATSRKAHSWGSHNRIVSDEWLFDCQGPNGFNK